MKKLSFLILSMVGTLALADTPIDQTLDADANGEVTISNVSGSVEVSGWSRSQVKVTGSLGDGVEELIFERDGDDVLIKVKHPRNSRHIGSSDLIVSVPEGSSLKISTVSAEIDIEDVEGEQRLNSVSGDITTAFQGPEINAESVSGDIEVAGSDQEAEIRLNSVSGDIDVADLSGEISVESVNGDIAVMDGSFSRVNGNTVNGEITLHAGLRSGGRIDLETINGEIDIEFEGDVSARFDIETFNGHIRNCFGPDPVRTSKYVPGRELDFTEGGGTGRVRINTLNGGVKICK